MPVLTIDAKGKIKLPEAVETHIPQVAFLL